MKIFLVDDDKIIRMGLRKIINRESNEFEIVGEASNGLEALKLIGETKPDIVLTDIKMPIMNGIDLIENIKRKGIKCKSIVLSGFDEYQFVRETMKNGASDYLLKPINSKELLELLYSIQKLIIKEQLEYKNYEKSMVYSKKIIHEQNILASLLNKDLIKDDSCIINKESFQKIRIILLSMTLKNSEIIWSSLDNIEKKIRIKMRMSKEIFSIVRFEDNLIVFSDDKNYVPLLETIKEICITDKYITYAYSEEISSYQEIKNAYDYCINEMMMNFYEHKNLNENKLSKSDTIIVEEHIELLINYLQLLNREKFKSTLINLYRVFLEKNIRVKTLKYYFIKLIEASRIKVEDFDMIYMNDENELIQIKYIINTAMRGQLLVDHIIKLYFKVMDRIILIRENRGDRVIEMAKGYIEENYNKDISLGEVADHIYLNPNYLSELFKKKVGKKFIDYLVEIRINKAKELLANPGIKIYQVAQEVGYNEYISFNRAFKRVVGISPKEYIELIK